MTGEKMYALIGRLAQVLDRNGACRRGRRTGDEVNDVFLRQVRLRLAALKKFSMADQKEWHRRVAEVNDDLIRHWRFQAQAQRVHTRKQRAGLAFPLGLRRRHAEQGDVRFLRMQAIKDVIADLDKERKKTTVKAVNIGLAKCFPEIPLVQLDTLRKDIKRLKVARQSG
jgi:hypothetical protein